MNFHICLCYLMISALMVLSSMPVGETLLSNRLYMLESEKCSIQKLSNCAKNFQFDDDRILGLEIKTNHEPFLFISI